MYLILMLACFLFGAEAASSGYIIGGEISEKGKWPWQISLQRYVEDGDYFTHSCGGSILNEYWILTAGHCTMYNWNPENYRVKVGMFQLSANDYEQELRVEKIIFHPDFNLTVPGLPNDLTLLHLAEPIDLSNPYVGTIKLASEDIIYAGNPNCWISGWGRNNRSSDLASDLLREANVPVLTNAECKKKYGILIWLLPLWDSHVCMGNPAIEDIHACHGDSGGPLQCLVEDEWQIVGVASRTGPMDCENYPSVYIRVSSFVDWILSHIES